MVDLTSVALFGAFTFYALSKRGALNSERTIQSDRHKTEGLSARHRRAATAARLAGKETLNHVLSDVSNHRGPARRRKLTRR